MSLQELARDVAAKGLAAAADVAYHSLGRREEACLWETWCLMVLWFFSES